MSQRADRVAEAFREEIMDIIQKSLKDPRIGLTTVTNVRVTNDLQHAVVYISVLGDSNDKKETLKRLIHAKGYIRSEMGKRVRLKFLPDIDFKLDNTVEEQMRVAEILHKLHEEEEDE